jgi:trehalose 6-phosphate phosphatase
VRSSGIPRASTPTRPCAGRGRRRGTRTPPRPRSSRRAKILTWIERKAFGFGLHTRLSSPTDAAAAAAAVDDIVARQAPHWRRRSGRDILEFAWRHEGKDSAVAQLREQTGATAVVFAGDDVTDEDALASLGESDLGIRVGEGETAASVRVADAKELAGVLSALARLRAAARS